MNYDHLELCIRISKAMVNDSRVYNDKARVEFQRKDIKNDNSVVYVVGDEIYLLLPSAEKRKQQKKHAENKQ